MEDAALINLLPEWLAFSQDAPVDPGLSREEAGALASSLLGHLEDAPADWDDSSVDPEKMKDVLHALVADVLPRSSPSIRLVDAVYRLVQRFPWRPYEQPERLELCRRTADLGWRLIGMDVRTVRQLRITLSDWHGSNSYASNVEGTSETPQKPKTPASIELASGESISWLFDFCGQLWRRFEYGVSQVHRESVEAWARLSGKGPVGILDEGPFFRGELARLAGATCRFEGRWDEAQRWFERAEKEYVQTLDADIGLAQLAFARIGLLYHRYEYAEALENSERLSPILDYLGMHSRAQKCRLAAAMALKAMGRLDQAIVICERLVKTGGEDLQPSFFLHAYAHLADAYKQQGRMPEAERCLQEGARRLAACEGSLAAADFQLVYADQFRARGDFATAAEIFAQAKQGYSEVGMLPFAAYASVLLAETLMMLDRRALAEAELYWALPMLEEFGMSPEGCAAVALLREALRLRRLDHDVLRAFRTSLKM